VVIINLILSTHFLFWPTHFFTAIILSHLPSSMMNCRCEKVAVGEGWLGRVAGNFVVSGVSGIA
jgi:hypothetical protein